VEFLSISEYLDDHDIDDPDDKTAQAIDEAIREATVTVEWSSGRDPAAALRDLAAEARSEPAATPAGLALVDALDAAADAYPTDPDSPVVAALARFAVAMADEDEEGR
jgi:inactivated superfamily I helicase